MKSLAGYAGQRKERKEKQSTNESEAKYWGTLGKAQHPFKRSDGSISTDKTLGWHSRPGHKEAVRNANRAITKQARQILKRQMLEEVES